MASLYPTFQEVAKKAKTKDYISESFLVPLDILDFRRRIYSNMWQLSVDEADFAKIKGISSERLFNLLSDNGSNFILTDEIFKLFGNSIINQRTEECKRNTEARLSPQLNSPKIEPNPINPPPGSILLHKDNFRKIVKFLRTKVAPGITNIKMAEFSGLPPNRFNHLLKSPNANLHIKEEEVNAIWQLYSDLKSGKKVFSPRVNKKRPISDKIQPPPGYLKLNRFFLNKFFEFLQKMRPGFTLKEFSEAADIPFTRLRGLFKNIELIKQEEVFSIFQVPNKLNFDETRN